MRSIRWEASFIRLAALAAAALLIAADIPHTTASAPAFGSVTITWFGGAPPYGGSPVNGRPAAFGLADRGMQQRFARLMKMRAVLPEMKVEAITDEWTFHNVQIIGVKPPTCLYSAVVTFSFEEFTDAKIEWTPNPHPTPVAPSRGDPAYFVSEMTGKMRLLNLSGDELTPEFSHKLFLTVNDAAVAQRSRALVVRHTLVPVAYIENAYGDKLLTLANSQFTGYRTNGQNPTISVTVGNAAPATYWLPHPAPRCPALHN